MRTSIVLLAIIAVAGLAAAPASIQETAAESPYDVVDGWLKPFTPGYGWGSQTAVFAESPDRIFVTQRGEIRLPDPVPPGFAGFVSAIGINPLQPGDARVWRNCIVVVDGDGNMIEAWTQWDHLYEGSNGPHRIRINPHDPERRVWVVHETGHVIHVFSNDGSELLMTLGEMGVSGNDETHFGRPQDVAFLPDGSAFVADGLDNSRVVKFDAEGNYVTSWPPGGEKGNTAGQFDGVHAIATDARGFIYVADRNNKRIQIFNQTGDPSYHPNISPMGAWLNFDSPFDVYVTGTDVWVSDNQPAELIRLDVYGNRLDAWRMDGDGPGQFNQLHQFSVDREGALYAADPALGRTQKFVPKSGADSARLIAPPDPPVTSPSRR